MASLNDLIKELMLSKECDNVNNNDNDDAYFDRRLNNAESVYDRLSTDFPTISCKQLKLLLDDLTSRFQSLDITSYNQTTSLLPPYKLNNIILNTLSEYTLKYNSSINNDNNNSNSTSASTITKQNQEYANIYSSLYYLFYIKLLRYILKVKNVNELIEYLDRYYIEDHNTDTDDSDVDSNEDEDKDEDVEILSIPAATNTATGNVDDNDSDNYQDFNCGVDVSKEFYDAKFTHNNNISDWSFICEKISSIYKQSFCYDHISQDTVWEDYSIMDDIKDIIDTLFKDEHFLPLVSLIPMFIYILRDRILSKPNEIPYILPQLLDILIESNASNNNTSDTSSTLLSSFQISTLLSLFDSFVSIPPKSMSKRSLDLLNQSIINRCLPHFTNRLSYWNSLESTQLQHLNSNELSTISKITMFIASQKDYSGWDQTYLQKGLYTQYLTLTLKLLASCNNSNLTSDANETLHWLTSICCQSEMLCKFTQKVPELKSYVYGQSEGEEDEAEDNSASSLNNMFKNRFVEYYAVWMYLSAICPVNKKQKQEVINSQVESFVQILETMANDNTFKEPNFTALNSLSTIVQLLLLIRGENALLPTVTQFLGKLETKVVDHIKQLLLLKHSAPHNQPATTNHHDTDNQEQRIQDKLKQQLIQLRTQLKSLPSKDSKKN